MTAPDKDDSAQLGFAILTMMRLMGAGLTLFGALVIGGKVALPAPAGAVFLLFGVFEALVLPALIARRWQSPK